jgi:hypothetical protein
MWKIKSVLLNLLLIFSTFIFSRPCDAQIKAAEYEVRAAYVASFGTYVDWPINSFQDKEAPFIIGVMNDEKLVDLLEQAFKTRKIQGRNVLIRPIKNIKQALDVHVLYNGDPDYANFSDLKKLPILTIGLGENTLQSGGVIRLINDNNRLRFEFNHRIAERVGLKVSAKLQQLALRTYDGELQ